MRGGSGGREGEEEEEDRRRVRRDDNGGLPGGSPSPLVGGCLEELVWKDAGRGLGAGSGRM